MATDLRSVALKAAANALKQAGSGGQSQPPPEPKKPALSTGKAILLGAGLATAGRALISSRGRDMVGSVRDRLQDEHAEHEEDEYEDEFDEEPEAEADEDFDDEDYDDEPEAEEDEDFDDEDVDEDVDEEPDERPARRRRSVSRNRS